MVQAELLTCTGAGHRHEVLHDLTEDLRVHEPAVNRQVRGALLGVGELLGSPDLGLGPRGDPRFTEVGVAVAPGGALCPTGVHTATALHQRPLPVGRQHAAVHGELACASGLAQALLHPYTPHVRPRRELEPHPGPGPHVPVAVQAVGLPGGRGVVVQHVVQGEIPGVGPAVAASGGGEGRGGDLQRVPGADLASCRRVDFDGSEEAHVLDLPAKLQSLGVVHQHKLLRCHVLLLHALHLGGRHPVQLLVEVSAAAGEPTRGVGADATILRQLTGVHTLSTLIHIRCPHEIRVGVLRHHRPPVRVLRVLGGRLGHGLGESVVVIVADGAAVGGAGGGLADVGEGAGVEAEHMKDAGVVGVEAQRGR
mmetsp:Transcript_33918/g.88324  ORF Transcript_33918/g.88324 Transcript_33918/m.88324 type:complete len:366 (-) Transcript_33918:3253-4350(-)